jgi:hypothetical protein
MSVGTYGTIMKYMSPIEINQSAACCPPGPSIDKTKSKGGNKGKGREKGRMVYK